MLAAGEIQLVADVTALWVALSGVVRGPDGRYPVRLADDPALSVSRYLQTVAVRFALQEGNDIAVTTSRRDQASRWRALADDAQTEFNVRTVDPGEDIVRARLSEADGNLSPECSTAIGRWFSE